MQRQLPMDQSPRCGVHSRRSGKPCRNGASQVPDAWLESNWSASGQPECSETRKLSRPVDAEFNLDEGAGTTSGDEISPSYALVAVGRKIPHTFLTIEGTSHLSLTPLPFAMR